MNNTVRACPLCGHTSTNGLAFPYLTFFNNHIFKYLKCASCRSVFVDPVPDAATFARMYTKADYHDCYYEDRLDDARYSAAAALLSRHAPQGARVLDYGCGLGGFLKAVGAVGFRPFGVEFDEEVGAVAGRNANCMTTTVDAFWADANQPLFDVIHLGDVLEHLPDPGKTLAELVVRLKPGGLLFVEGPLENNASPVYWTSALFGRIKRLLKPSFIGNAAPTYLFRTGARQQLQFFARVEPGLTVQHWGIHETGWPYANGGRLKRAINASAHLLGGRRFARQTFGNRFSGVFRYEPINEVRR